MLTPLADRLRPKNISEIAGQSHLVSEGMPLAEIIRSKKIPNMIFYGPSGVGKTTMAYMIAKISGMYLQKLNATTAKTSDIRDLYSKIGTFEAINGILLYLDEIQYFNRKQQQTLLEAIETGQIILIASTTENPYFYIYNAILSRCSVFEFKSIKKDELKKVLLRAIDILSSEDNKKIFIDSESLEFIAKSGIGDARKALNSLELCIISIPETNGKIEITIDKTKNIVQQNILLNYDKSDDNHYDLLSAFQKSMRGSDSDAAIHYLARLLISGDLISACRRLMVCACEDVGLAYPNIISIVKASVDIALQVGLPEARIPLADAVILVCNAPKSNSAYIAINKAYEDIENGKTGNIPRNLQNNHFDGDNAKIKGQNYKYPHDYDNHWVNQQYLPDELLKSKYYEYGNNKIEQNFKQYWENMKN